MENKGYYNENTIRKFTDEMQAVKMEMRSGKEFHVSISKANSKMGAVASVSLLPFITCPTTCKCTCGSACYAAKLANLRPNVRHAWAVNTILAIYKPAQYWAEVEQAVKAVRFFRFHVSGDIMNKAYFHHMVDIANNNPHTEILCFTKQYDFVNAMIEKGFAVPANLHLLFSGWTNLEPVNPHNFPETNIIERGAEPAPNWKVCSGNCFSCAINGAGCWTACKGETIAFHKH